MAGLALTLRNVIELVETGVLVEEAIYVYNMNRNRSIQLLNMNMNDNSIYSFRSLGVLYT